MIAAFLLMVAIAGGNAVAIRYISCESCELDPFWAAGTRFALAALIFGAYVLWKRIELPRGGALLGAVLYGALTFGGAFGFAYWGFVRVEAGLGGVLLATVPLLTFAFALAHRQETFRWERLAGGALAVIGTAAVFRDGLDTGAPMTRMLSLLVGAACFAEGAIVVKHFPPARPAAMNAIGMGVGGLVLLALAPAFGESYALPRESSTLWAQAYLVVLGSIGVFALYLFVLGRWTASATSYEGVLIPLVTILLSAWLLDEDISGGFALGALLIVLGVYLGALRVRAADDVPAATPSDLAPADPENRSR